MSRYSFLVSVWLGLSFGAIQSESRYLTGTQLSSAEMADVFAQPGLLRILGYGSLALLCLALFWSRERLSYTRLVGSRPLLLLLAYCGLSIMWSAVPGYSATRYLGLIAYCGCAFGMASRFDWATLRKICQLGCGIIVVLGFGLELLLATCGDSMFAARPSGPLHPNAMAAYCTFLLLSLLPDLKTHIQAKIGAGVVFSGLLLTGSRAGFVALLAGILVFALLIRGKAVLVGSLLILPLGALTITLTRDQPVEGLNGRVRLWELLWQEVQIRPLAGYGYEGFWLPSKILEVSSELQWAVPSAHSAPLEVLLSLGFPGLALVTWFCTIGLGSLLAAPKCIERSFALAIIASALVLSTVESTFVKPYSLYGLLFLSILLRPSQGERDVV